jgi:hypothetical protein
VLPNFWLAAGATDKSDVTAAVDFRGLLLTRVPDVPLLIIPGGGHQASVWRAALGPMLTWMTPQLAANAAKRDANVARAAAAKAAAARAAAAKKKAHGARPRPTHTPARPGK